MGWNDHQDVELTDGLRRLLDEGQLEADGSQAVLALYIINHGFAALSEEQQQQFHDDLLPLLDLRSRSDELDAMINDPGNEDPGSLIDTDDGLRTRR
ncbi:hypothetical protein JVX91_19935 [Pseudomonas sp. PDNC002]|uniref:hypothetical protein n=1 Tax=Pseudomonas sp. PDNC002 TaxID=2811422 RepID=UPI0019652B71|nr:hypothetical protein [Pseudomonas sp. PDNC002]QRY82547.1 hypothetical protein JVX91_19935 [Pseudomonas sp. PDNC002]